MDIYTDAKRFWVRYLEVSRIERRGPANLLRQHMQAALWRRIVSHRAGLNTYRIALAKTRA